MYFHLKCSLRFTKVWSLIAYLRKLALHEQNVASLVEIFNSLFEASEQTVLITGANEPIYLPGTETGGLNQLITTHDYFSSALHEVSHWCIAGSERRKLRDFGYWYKPDGRTASEQIEFEQVEVKPQALEWLFTEACKLKFRLSVDNLNQPEVGASESFQRAVAAQTHRYLEKGLPSRAELFFQALVKYYRPNDRKIEKTAFSLSSLT
jgi:hypothetical protein